MTSDHQVSDSQGDSKTTQKSRTLSSFREIFWDWAADLRARRLRREALDGISAMNDNLRRDIGVGRGRLSGMTQTFD